MKRTLIKAKQRRINEYEIFLNKLLIIIKRKVINQDNNHIYFKDGIEDIVGFNIKDIYNFLIDFFRSVRNDVSESIGEFREIDKPLFDSIIEENVILVSSILIDERKALARIIKDGVVGGKSISVITKEISTQLGVARQRSETIAITETAKANSKFALDRCKELNIVTGVWSASKDKRTRVCHTARAGKKYELNKGCYSPCDGKFIQTGFEIRCRCAMVIYL